MTRTKVLTQKGIGRVTARLKGFRLAHAGGTLGVPRTTAHAPPETVMPRRDHRPRFTGPPRVAYDGPKGPKRVTGHIRQALGSAGPVHLAVAYVTQDLEKLLPVSRTRLREITLVCDPWSGACNPDVLERLHESGARVYARRRLHAKVYAGPGGAVVGSANLSGDALVKGTEEAVTLLPGRAASKDAARWVQELAAASTSLVDLMADVVAWGAIKAAWRQHQEWKPRRRGLQPSLLEALTHPFDHDLTDIRIDLIDEDAEDFEKAAKTEADRKRLRLPPGWSHTYVDGIPKGYTLPRYLSAYEDDVEGCAILTLYIKADEARGRVLKFTSVDQEVGSLIGAAHRNGRVIWYYRMATAAINLKRDRRELVTRLNAALKAGGVPLQEKLWRRSWWSLKPKEIADLLPTSTKH